MARQRRRRDQIWNPPSRGTDISALFVLFAAGPLLLPLVGAQIAVIAFVTPLAFCLFASWRCGLAARRSRLRRSVWVALSASTLAAAMASVIAIVHPQGDVAFDVGASGSALLAIAMLDLARRSLAGARLERVVDGLLFPVLAGSVAIWFAVIPGFREGDHILTSAVAFDVLALCAAALAMVVRPCADHVRFAAPLVLGMALATVGDGLISSDAAGLLSTSGLATALLWAGAAYSFALAADLDIGEPLRASARNTEGIAATRWVIARVILPLASLIVIPLVLVALYAADELDLAAIIWFATTFLLVLALAFGRQAYLLLDNRRWVIREGELRKEVMRRNEELEALTGLASTMTQTLEEGPIVERGLGVLHLAAHASSSALFTSDDELVATNGAWPSERTWAGKPGTPPGGRAVAVRAGRQILRLGLSTRGNDIGYVTLIRSDAEPYLQNELDLLGLLGDQLAIAIQNARDYREKLEQAIRDPLTGLYNRRFFYEALAKEVQRSIRYGASASLVLFDVDDFKAINDTLGHHAGDETLCKIAEIAAGLIRPVDSFARLGGEEFGLLLPETDQLEALLAAERLRTAISRHAILPDRRVTLSGGVACCPTDALTLEDLGRKADAALYWAKRNGKNLCALAEPLERHDLAVLAPPNAAPVPR